MHVAPQHPAVECERRKRVDAREHQVGVTGKRDVRVEQRQRRDEIGADQRSKRRNRGIAQRAVRCQRERHEHQQPRPVHRGIVPASECNRAPDLQQGNRRPSVGGSIEECDRRPRKPDVGGHEGGDARELIPHPRLGRPLCPRFPGAKGPPGDLDGERSEAKRQPREQQHPCDPLPSRKRGPNERARRFARPGERHPLVAPRKQPQCGRRNEQRRADRQSAETDPRGG